MLLAATNGAFDKVPVEKIKAAEASMLRDLKHDQPKLVELINTGVEADEKGKEAILKLAQSVAKAYEHIDAKKA